MTCHFVSTFRHKCTSFEEGHVSTRKVFRFYAGNARQLAQLLVDFLMKHRVYIKI